MNRLLALLFSVFIAGSVAAGQAAAQAAETAEAAEKKPDGREKLGFRIGYVLSASDIKNQFGHGSAVQLHFTEKIKPPLYFNIQLGAIYLGESDGDAITQRLFGPGVSDANLRILTLAAGPTLELPILNHGSLYLSGSAGLYSISVLLEMGLFSSDTSNERFGVNLASGYYWPLTDQLSLDVNFTFHHIWTKEIDKDPSDWSVLEDPRELFWLYSNGDSDPNFFQFSLGVAYRLN